MENLPFKNSLCYQCENCGLVKGRHTVFLKCSVLEKKYVPQPVQDCALFLRKKTNEEKHQDS